LRHGTAAKRERHRRADGDHHGFRGTIAPAASVALATSVMVLPAAAPEFADTEKLDPTVGRVPEMLAGAAIVPGPWPRATAGDRRARGVPRAGHGGEGSAALQRRELSGEVIATWTAVMLIAAEVTAAALMVVPALASVPVAPAVRVKVPSVCAVKAM